MTRKKLVVAALLLTGLVGVAAAADNGGHKRSANAQRVIATLDSVGLINQDVRDFVDRTDSHISHGYLNLSEDKMLGGRVQLRYKLGLPSPRRLELVYLPTDDDHLRVTATTRGVMLSYHLDFK